MRGPSTLLWELIHSLNSKEVQKFKDRAFEYKRGRYANYIVLFDAVMSQKSFDNEALKNELADYHFVKHLHRTKNYLYKRVLDFIGEANPNEESNLYGLIRNVKILYEKRLFSHLPPQIAKGKRLAAQLDDFSALRKLIEYEIGVLKYSRGWKSYDEEIDRLLDEENRIRTQENNLYDIQILAYRFLKIWNKSQEEKELMLKNVANIPLVNDPRLALSVSASVIQKEIAYNRSIIERNYRKTLVICDEIITIFDKNRSLAANNSRYTTLCLAIFHSAMYSLMYFDFEKADVQIEKLNSIANVKDRSPILFHEYITRFEITKNIKKPNYEAGNKAIINFESISHRYEQISDKVTAIKIAHLAGEFYIYFGQPELALKWITKNRNRKVSSHRPDLLHFSRIMFLIAHWELGNDEVIEREVKSIKSSFKKHFVMNEFYLFILSLFGNLTKKKEAKIDLLKKALITLRTNSSSILWKTMSNYLDIESWLVAKVEMIPIKQVMTRKNAEIKGRHQE